MISDVIKANELHKIEKILPEIRKYLSKDANKVIDEKGCAEIDIDDELVTNTVKNRDCVFVVKENGIYLCAIEKLFLQKKIDFNKPISCHLYPIRLEEKDGLFNLKYDSWYICASALSRNRELSKPTIIFLKYALIRQFGKEWYEKAISYYQKFFNFARK